MGDRFYSCQTHGSSKGRCCPAAQLWVFHDGAVGWEYTMVGGGGAGLSNGGVGGNGGGGGGHACCSTHGVMLDSHGNCAKCLVADGEKQGWLMKPGIQWITSDADRHKMAERLVADRNLQTLDEAKEFAIGWIEIAAHHCTSEEWYRKEWNTERQSANRLQERCSELSDLNGGLRTENDELLRENAKLRRRLEASARRK